jgi:hypothetical protein
MSWHGCACSGWENDNSGDDMKIGMFWEGNKRRNTGFAGGGATKILLRIIGNWPNFIANLFYEK